MTAAITMSTIIFQLSAVRALTNEILEEAGERKEQFDGDGINWGDLSCTDTLFVVNDGGETEVLAIVEEVSPSATKLPAFVENRLREWGYEVSVETEW